MGQTLMDPPTVEGWHTGKEWIDGGTLTERVNFAVSQVSDLEQARPAARSSRRLEDFGRPLGPEELVDSVLDLAGPLEVQPETRAALVDLAAQDGELRFGSDDEPPEERGAHRPAAPADRRLARVPVRLI